MRRRREGRTSRRSKRLHGNLWRSKLGRDERNGRGGGGGGEDGCWELVGGGRDGKDVDDSGSGTFDLDGLDDVDRLSPDSFRGRAGEGGKAGRGKKGLQS